MAFKNWFGGDPHVRLVTLKNGKKMFDYLMDVHCR